MLYTDCIGLTCFIVPAFGFKSNPHEKTKIPGHDEFKQQ